MSKFLFHLKFSKSDNYLHEHELYEVMRSRNLYQTQFEVRANFHKRMRNIEISEKAKLNGHENSRKLFVQKMKERMEQADKMREVTATLKRKAASYLNMYTSSYMMRERVYVPLPAASQRQELPDIHQKTKLTSQPQPLSQNTPSSLPPASAPNPNSNPKPVTTHQTTAQSMSPPNPPSTPRHLQSTPHRQTSRSKSSNSNKTESGPTCIATPTMPAVSAVDEGSVIAKPITTTNGEKLLQRKSRHSSKVLVAGKNSPRTKTIDGSEKQKDNNIDEELDDEEDRDIFNDNEEETVENTSNASEKKDVVGPLTSTVHFTDSLTASHIKTDSDSASVKCAEWTKQHPLISKSNKSIDVKSYQRLLIDRPSKWALSHMSNSALNLVENSLRFGNNTSFVERYKSKAKKLDALSEKLKLNKSDRISLPELDTTPKPMVSMTAGGTTPDGRLILTKADYEDYLSDYKKARNIRLNRSKRKCKFLTKLVDEFRVSPKLSLRDETDILLTGSC